MGKLNILLFAILMLAFAMSVKDTQATIDTFGGLTITLNNNTIIGGANTGSTADLTVSRPVSGAKNWSMLGLFTNASGGTWTRATLASVASNTTCYLTNRGCNHTGSGNRGAMRFTFTLPSDVIGSFLRVQYNSSALTTKANFTKKITFDSAGPTLTFVDPTPAMNARRDNGSWTMNMTTGENVTSCTFTREPNTVVTTATLAASDQAGWASYSSMAAARYSFSGTCLDYAADGANSGSTSENRIIQKASDPSPITEEILGTTGTGLSPSSKKKIVVGIVIFVVFVGGLVVMVLAMNGKSRRKRRR